MQERRLTVRMKAYWESLRGSQGLPDMALFNHAKVEDLWPRCLRLKVIREQNKMITYLYQYMGADIISAYGKDLTGQFVNAHMHNFPGAHILKRIDEVVANPPTLAIDDGQFVNDKHAIIKYRACLLPFGNDEDGVSHVIAGLSWKEF